jgi:hypothetical protein
MWCPVGQQHICPPAPAKISQHHACKQVALTRKPQEHCAANGSGRVLLSAVASRAHELHALNAELAGFLSRSCCSEGCRLPGSSHHRACHGEEEPELSRLQQIIAAMKSIDRGNREAAMRGWRVQLAEGEVADHGEARYGWCLEELGCPELA